MSLGRSQGHMHRFFNNESAGLRRCSGRAGNAQICWPRFSTACDVFIRALIFMAAVLLIGCSNPDVEPPIDESIPPDAPVRILILAAVMCIDMVLKE